MVILGYELFGEERASCTDGENWPEAEDLPQCAINMARYDDDDDDDGGGDDDDDGDDDDGRTPLPMCYQYGKI